MLQKKRSKSQSSLAYPFWASVIICLAGAALNSKLLYDNIYKAISKLNEEPIATVTFKYKTAQRKFLGRAIWDRLKQDSEVYNGDTIHTSSGAEATIHFTDGNQMDLSENTMAQVFLEKDKKIKAELGKGNATFDSSEASNSIILNSDGVDVEILQGSVLSAANSGESSNGEKPSTTLQVTQGSAKLVSGSSSHSLSEGSSLILQGTEPKKVTFSIASPGANEIILRHEEGNTVIPFNWKYFDDEEDSENKTTIQISQNKNFSSLVYNEVFTNTEHADVQLEKGNYYWKIIHKDKEASGKLKIIQALPPTLITPVENFEFNFRKKLPSVRLIWSEVPYATAYKIEISKNKEMKNPFFETRSNSTSFIIQTIDEGTYFWRVTPFFTVKKEGFTAPSAVHTFTVSKKGNLNSPVLYIPVQNGLMNTQSESKNKNFSWKDDSEAESYEITISNNESLKNPLAVKKVRTNFYELENNIDVSDGKWYWAVRQIDSEGNYSNYSDIRTFFSMKGAPEQHTIEPVDGYKVSKSLVPDMKFTWKKNLPENFETFIQISKDESFSNLIVNEKVTNSGFGGISLSEGSYFWRIHSSSTTDEATLSTAPKSFTIVGNLAKAVLLDPLTKAVARENNPYKFKWEAVPDADYYKFTIFNTKDESKFEGITYEPSISVDLFDENFKDKSNYRYEVQGKANAIPGIASRRNGELSQNNFYLVKLRPVEIILPKKNVTIKGDEAILNPPYLEWSSVDKVKEAQVVITRINDGERTIVYKNPTDLQFAQGKKIAPQRLLFDTPDGLRSGKYEIVVHAKTFDDIDISNTDRKYIGTFTVLPIEKLPKPLNLVSKPSVFDETYLRSQNADKAITLSWNKVSNATDYFVEIKNKNGKTVLEKNIKETSYKIDFTSLSNEDKVSFSKGTFIWNAYAVRRIDTDKDGKVDKILQEGEKASGRFETNIPSPKKSKAKGASNPYGK